MNPSSPYVYDALVLGGGAAGLFCAGQMGLAGLKVALVEKNGQLGRKLLASGGGNCNFTHLDAEATDYQGQNPRFAQGALGKFGPRSVLELFEQAGLRSREKNPGQLFCAQGAGFLQELLVQRCKAGQVELITGTEAAAPERCEAGFKVPTSSGELYAKAVVVATGGLSYPALGANDSGLRWAKDFGLKLVRQEPALVPLKLSGLTPLAGVSLPAAVHLGKQVFEGDLLFTHHGLSGPAILQASLFWEPGQELIVDFLPGQDWGGLLAQAKAQGKRSLTKALPLPERFAQFWLEREGAERFDLHHLTKDQTRQLERAFKEWRFLPQGTEGYKKAEVTKGGLSTQELDPKTLQAKKVPDLYFIGEVVDLTGPIGGYNFQWAWSSAYAAAEAILKKYC